MKRALDDKVFFSHTLPTVSQLLGRYDLFVGSNDQG